MGRHRARGADDAKELDAAVLTVAVIVAGVIGSVLRYLVDTLWRQRWPSPFPWPVMAINVSGSFVLGLIAGAVIFAGAGSTWQSVLGTGLCGGYTTFSTASVDAVRLVQQGRAGQALAYAVGSAVISIATCAAGLALVYAVR